MEKYSNGTVMTSGGNPAESRAWELFKKLTEPESVWLAATSAQVNSLCMPGSTRQFQVFWLIINQLTTTGPKWKPSLHAMIV